MIYTPHATETSGSHVEIVTAVNKDDNGQTTSVRVEESTSPTVKTTIYSAASSTPTWLPGTSDCFASRFGCLAGRQSSRLAAVPELSGRFRQAEH